jgi:hypothetical protein
MGNSQCERASAISVELSRPGPAGDTDSRESPAAAYQAPAATGTAAENSQRLRFAAA